MTCAHLAPFFSNFHSASKLKNCENVLIYIKTVCMEVKDKLRLYPVHINIKLIYMEINNVWLSFFILTLGSHCSRLPSARTADMSVKKEKSTQGEENKITRTQPRVQIAKVKPSRNVYAFLQRGLDHKNPLSCVVTLPVPGPLWFKALVC